MGLEGSCLSPRRSGPGSSEPFSQPRSLCLCLLQGQKGEKGDGGIKGSTGKPGRDVREALGPLPTTTACPLTGMSECSNLTTRVHSDGLAQTTETWEGRAVSSESQQGGGFLTPSLRAPDL